MSCPTADMESCDKKCKCVGGPCAGTAYDCDDPCSALGEEFNAQTCECELIYGTSNVWDISYSYNNHSTQPCDGGLTADPCDTTGACFTGVITGQTGTQSFGAYEITATGFWQGGRYAATNSGCPTNVAPDTTTFADMGIPADWVVTTGVGGSYGGRTSASTKLFPATSASLVMLGVDQLGERWAWQVRSLWSGSVRSLWKDGDWAFDISLTPA